MSFTLMATRSMPTVSCFFIRKASLSLVPTPSVPETITGFLYFFDTSKSAPKPPMPPSTSGRIVRLAIGLMRSTSASPASMSTPASRYVSWECLPLTGGNPVDLEAKFYTLSTPPAAQVSITDARRAAAARGSGVAAALHLRQVRLGELEHPLDGPLRLATGLGI